MNTINELNFYKSITSVREDQANDLYEALNKHFNFEVVECIETGASQNLQDGCFGLFLGKITEKYGGTFHSVDINSEIVNKSKDIFNQYLPSLNISHHIEDSVNFLKKYEGSPNLVHLDSWDLDLKNPVRSMLHGWLEFVEIKDKMPSGSLIVIDDNFFKGTWITWNYFENGEVSNSEKITIDYDIIGKGSLIYHWCEKEENDWDIIRDNIKAGVNIKLIIKKR